MTRLSHLMRALRRGQAMLPNMLVRCAFTVLALSIAAAGLAPLAAAQTPKRRTTTTTTAAPSAVNAAAGPATASGPSSANMTLAVHPDLMTVNGAADLIIQRLGFTSKGEITFELKNRGDVPINPVPGGPAPNAGVSQRQAAPPVPESQQIKVMLYLSNAPVGTVFQPRLGGERTKTFTVTLPANLKPRCGASAPLRTVIDPSNVIAEYTDTNNVDTTTAARPCPDLAVQSIKKNFNELKTHYSGRVTIVNQGNAPIEKFEYWARENFGGHLADLGGQADDTAGPLGPGETFKFNIGHVPAYDNMQISVILDWNKLVEELDENNNYKEKNLN